ncbi:conserved hypothetical protein [Burkholderia sp. 8Y]|nr:conserved hypothetical protein [Burkholderia sp. 8Y]
MLHAACLSGGRIGVGFAPRWLATSKATGETIKPSPALANRELFIFVAIVASAITLHVREHGIDRSARVRAAYTPLCEPSAHGASKARLRPADCSVSANAPAVRIAGRWV